MAATEAAGSAVGSARMSTGERWFVGGLIIGAIVVLLIVGLTIFRLFWVDFVDNYELGYKFDSRTGQITVLKESGYYVTPPFVVKIHTVDLRPMQVCINANQRVLNCKLVQFNSDGLELFLAWHGRQDYTIGNANSTLSQILLSYAYDGSGKNYPFLTVLRELKNEEKQ